MNHAQYAQQILAVLPRIPATLPPVRIDESRRNNAGRCMTALACHRLAQGGEAPQHLRHATFDWNGGVFALRNSRITDHHWSTAQDNVVGQFHELGDSRPVVYLLTYWAIEDRLLHVWAVPENVAFDAFARLPAHVNTNSKSVEVGPDDHQLKNVPGAPSFAPYYAQIALTEAEVAKLMEAIKTDDNIKQQRLAAETEEGDEDAEAAVAEQKAADAQLLRQIVRFSVLPYVRELMTLQFGQADAEFEQQVSQVLLKCLSDRIAIAPPEPGHAQPSA